MTMVPMFRPRRQPTEQELRRAREIRAAGIEVRLTGDPVQQAFWGGLWIGATLGAALALLAIIIYTA